MEVVEDSGLAGGVRARIILLAALRPKMNMWAVVEVVLWVSTGAWQSVEQSCGGD